jgi:hypothetical protein
MKTSAANTMSATIAKKEQLEVFIWLSISKILSKQIRTLLTNTNIGYLDLKDT